MNNLNCLKINFLKWHILIFFLIISTITSFAQTTGKLSGRVVDENGEPLIGANILIEGTTKGAATDFEGYYAILNLGAGTYTVNFRYIGYQTKIVQNVEINADKTTNIN